MGKSPATSTHQGSATRRLTASDVEIPRMISTSGIKGTGYMKCMHGHPKLYWKKLILRIDPVHSHNIGRLSSSKTDIACALELGQGTLHKRNVCACALQSKATDLSLEKAAWFGRQSE